MLAYQQRTQHVSRGSHIKHQGLLFFNKTLLALQKDIFNQFASLETRLSEMSRPLELSLSPFSFEHVNETVQRFRPANNIIIRNVPEAPTNVNSSEDDT